ncbi:hypothetical protein [Ferrovibrio sp.]|uniref:hypothetical protein n=1 Tax=Ferrovibrio sp. TaxID=1917215 RepID=UPI00311DCDEE
MLFIGVMIVCLAGPFSVCEAVDIGVFSDRQLCLDTAAAAIAALPPDRQLVAVACDSIPPLPAIGQ